MNKINTRFLMTAMGAVLFCLPSVSVGAAGTAPWETQRFQAEPSAYQAAAASMPVPQGADVEVLYEETTVVIDDQNRWTNQYYMVFRVLTAKGASDWNSFSAGWSPWNQDRPVLELRVMGPDGSVRWMSPETLQESSRTDDSGNIYSDRMTLRGPLPGITVGAIIEERSTVRDRLPTFEAGTMERVVLGNSVPTRASRLVVEAPDSLPLRYSTALLPDLRMTKTSSSGTTRLTFDQASLPAWADYEPYLPSDIPRRPAVSFSTGASWQAIAAAYSAVVDKKIGAGPLLLPSITRSTQPREAKIDALVRWMAKEIRYTGIEFGESALVPRTPAETLARKFGDCKDKATLLVALLREAQIPADVALLRSGPGLDADPDLPGIGQFDHAIVRIPGPKDLWIDPTDEFARMGQLPSTDQGRQALPAHPQTKALVRIPQAESSENYYLETREVTMAAFGRGSVKETSQSFGALESNNRYFFAFRSEQKQKEWAVSYADDEYRTEQVSRFSVTDPNDLTKPLVWTTLVEKTPRATTRLNIATLWVRYERLFELLPSWLRTAPEEGDEKARQGDFFLPTPFVAEIQLKVRPPEGFTATLVPPSNTLPLGGGLLTETFSTEADGTILARLRFDTGSKAYSAAQATAMRKAILDLVAADPLEFRFEPVSQVLWNAGKVGEAFAEDKRLTGAASGSTEHKLRFALHLFNLGLGDAARKVARNAVDTDPQSAIAWQLLGEILSSDVVGREYRTGSDWSGAREAYAAAQKLDPENQDLAGNLAVLNEYNNEGFRYGAGAPLDQAIALYQSMGPEGREEAELEANLAYDLFYAGRLDEAAAAVAALSDPPLGLLLSIQALRNGAPAALTTASQKIPGNSARAEALRTAGNILIASRNYPQASVLLKAGAVGEAASQASMLSTVLAKTEKYAAPQNDKTGPASVVRRLLAFLVRDLSLSDDVRSLFTRNSSRFLSPGSSELNIPSLGTTMQALRQWGVSRETLTDLIMQMAQFRVDGNNDLGFRVRVTMPGAAVLSFLVLREDGDYRISAVTTAPGPAGSDLLEQLAAGKTASVRQALDWFREEMPQGNTDDPLSVPPFARFWKKGQDGTAAVLTEAVALLMTRSAETAPLGTDRLTPGKEIQEVALVGGYLMQSRYGEALPLAQDLLRRYPDSRTAFSAVEGALIGLKRVKEAVGVADAWLKRNPLDLQALSFQAEAYGHAGLAREAAAVWNTILSSGEAGAVELNNAAWNTLFVPGMEGAGLELALNAIRSNQGDSTILHTLACLFAVNGRVVEAKETMVKVMDLDALDAPDDNIRLIQGLVAEQVGLKDLARGFFTEIRSDGPDKEKKNSTPWLAQRHLTGAE